MNGVVEKINNERISFCGLIKNISKLEVKLYHNQMSVKLRRTKKMQNSTQEEKEELFSLQDARRKDT